MIFTSSFRRRLGALVLLLCLPAVPLQAAQKKRPRKPTPAKQEVPPPQPAPPPVELTLAQKPAVPPQVTYQDGQLTIIAENSTMGDVLRAVRTKTGAVVEIPANATERVVSHVGPGPARDVLATLLNGSSFNYVLLGAAGDPGAVQRVIVTPKPGGSDVTPVEANAVPANGIPPQVYGGAPPQSNESEIADGSETDNGTEEAEQPGPAQPQSPPQPGVKTPEQLLQELQQQQQMLQQQQQQQQGQPEPRN